MSNNIILDLYKDANIFYGITEDKMKEYKLLIKENHIKYKNLTLNEIYPNNDWMQLPLNSGLNRLIYLSYIEKDSLFLVSYKCLKTKEIGYTFQHNYNEILHPFHIVKHDFKLVDVDSRGVNYKCKNCNIDGFKPKRAPSGNIVVKDNYLIYNCNEYLIKGIIE